MSDHLGVGIKTGDSHRDTLMPKVGAHSTAALLLRAMCNGLINCKALITLFMQSVPGISLGVTVYCP